MSKLTDRTSYLKGLADGMKLNMEKDTNQLLMEVLNVLQEMAEEMERMSDAHDELNEYVESIDDDLTALEDDADAFSDSLDSDDDMDFDDDDDAFEEKLHVVQHHPSSNLLLNGRLCSSCNRLFMISFNDAPDAEYVCPFCGTQMKPNSIDPENLPTVSPAK